MVNVPTPATEGLNAFPLTPVPLKVPPVGFALSATVGAVAHKGEVKGVNVRLGKLFTEIMPVAVFMQPLASVPVTVYVVFDVGLSVIEALVDMVLQVYVLAPLAVMVPV